MKRLLSSNDRRMAFRIGQRAYLEGLTTKTPDLTELALPFGAEGEWFEMYFAGVEQQGKQLRRMRRCKGCSGCVDERPQFSELNTLMEQYGGFDRETLILMMRQVDYRGWPRYVWHVTAVHMQATPRNKAPQRARVPEDKTAKAAWEQHREKQREKHAKDAPRESDAEALRRHREARAARQQSLR